MGGLTSRRALMGEYFDKCTPESIDIFALNSNYLKTVAGERL
jgi:hypothetical protein